MSIWSSLSDGIDVPARDNYTGEQTDGDTITVDVARAFGWHDCVRLAMFNSLGCHLGEAMLSPGEVRALIALLEQAIDAQGPRSTPSDHQRT